MREINLRAALNEALRAEMARDAAVFIAGEDVAVFGGAFGVTRGLLAEFGEERVKDTPISESAILGLAVGAAAAGMRPVVEIMFMDFIGVGIDQLFNQAAKMKYMFGGKVRLPITVRCNFGAGMRAASQHSQSLEAWLCHIPGLKVVMPSTPCDGKGLLISSIRDDNPVVFLEHKGLYGRRGPVPEQPYTIPLGQAEVKREGSDVTVVATARMVGEALAAADSLAERDVSVEVVDPRTLVPLDSRTILQSVQKTHRLVVCHEAVRFCGFGAEIAASVAEEAFDYLDAPVKRVAAPFAPVPFSPVLEDAFVPNRDKIIAAIEEIL